MKIEEGNKMNKRDELLKDVPMLNINDKNFDKELEFALWSTDSSSDYSNDRDRPYNGQPHTVDGIRGKTEVKGLTMRDVKDCLIKAILKSSLYKGKDEAWRTQDVYNVDLSKIDPLALAQNLIVSIEKMMGIYPNIPKDL